MTRDKSEELLKHVITIKEDIAALKQDVKGSNDRLKDHSKQINEDLPLMCDKVKEKVEHLFQNLELKLETDINIAKAELKKKNKDLSLRVGSNEKKMFSFKIMTSTTGFILSIIFSVLLAWENIKSFFGGN